MHAGSSLELKVPPPVVGLVIATLMWLASSHVPRFEMMSSSLLVLLFAAAGVSCDFAGLWAFRRKRTTVNPMAPQKTSAIVDIGIYRFTRNPMYLGMMFMLCGWAMHLSSLWLLCGPLVFLLYIDRFQIVPEERALSSRFGKEYEAYRRRVRRWL
ncbi:MAG: isoprenylcysteine carboxylmethyltransferase family protein [Chromatiales bacterium]|jgi:protein-S-isoprenylcysteine O-methyltransferase Ste14|nr:isoprenylcysteine carboxylmethyltransferase family protein [Chromatiales bacterium]